MSSAAPDLTNCLSDSNLIETFIDDISSTVVATGSESIPAKTFHKHVCPGWTPELSNAHKISKSAWLKWKNAGKPSSSTDPIKVVYKDAKRHFRRLLKQLHNVQRFQFYDELTQYRKDSSRFFGLLRAYAGSQPVLTNVLACS